MSCFQVRKWFIFQHISMIQSEKAKGSSQDTLRYKSDIYADGKFKTMGLPDAIENYNNICFLGVGMQQIGLELPMSSYTKSFLKYVMASGHFHSVRDGETKRRLNEIGIKMCSITGMSHYLAFVRTSL